MVLTLEVGSKCALLLPQKFINPHLTPAVGLILNRFINSKSLILVEEVWQFKGLTEDAKYFGVSPSGRIRDHSWGWQSIPEITKKENEYLTVEVYQNSVMVPSKGTLDEIIKKAVEDFLKLRQKD